MLDRLAMALVSSVVTCLSAILRGQSKERRLAEEELKALEVTEGSI